MGSIQENENGRRGGGEEVILGVDGGATSTVCVCVPGDISHPLPILGRAITACTNHNSVGEPEARSMLKQVMLKALSEAGSKVSDVRAICLGVSGVNHPKDEQRLLCWLREIFPSHVKMYVHNDAVVALASGTMGKLKGCVLIAGTGSISYGCTEDGRQARASGAGPVLGDWGSGYGIAALALTAVMKAHDGRGAQTLLTRCILDSLSLSSPDEIIEWTYADPSWARIAALVPIVVSCAEAGDPVAHEILNTAVYELALSVKAVVRKLMLAGEDGKGSFPFVMVGGVLEANGKWDIGQEVINAILQTYAGAYPVRPKVEPAIGAALLALNLMLKEMEA
ncbi:kinase [Lithospermum erythrorhizon]|uniref:N-acetyl-D-glucosamine kinase n=1 Tax=Lithospermum erythrorhizon TaxID=34254 RepID=A0AAV3Q973_LITER